MVFPVLGFILEESYMEHSVASVSDQRELNFCGSYSWHILTDVFSGESQILLFLTSKEC